MGKAQGKVEVDVSNLQKAQLAFGQFGNSMLGIGAIALAGFGVAAKAAADFEKQIDLFGAVSGATAEELAAVSQRALQLGQDTIFGAGQVAEAIAELSKAGITTEDILEGAADAAVHLAAATDIDLKQAADVAANAMNTFNLEGKDMEGIVDSIAKAANASTVSVEDLSYSLKYAGGPAHALGLSIQETTLALGLMGKAGIRGSTAGTSLRRILLNLTPASKEAEAAMKELGIITADGSSQFYDATGNAKSLKDIMGVLHEATKNLTAEQKVQYLNTIFGNRAVSSAILLADQGAAGYDEFAASLAKLPSAAEISSNRLDNLSGDIEILKGNVETMLVQAGSPFQEFLRGLVQDITKLIAGFTALDPSVQKGIFNFILWGGVIFTAMGIITKIIGLLLNFGKAVYSVAKAIEFILKFTGVWGVFARALAPLILQFSLLGTRVGLLMLRFAPLARFLPLFLNPVGAVVGAILALGAVFVLAYKYIKPFHDGVDILWQSFQVGWDVILGFAKDLGGTLVNAIKTVVTSIQGFFTSIPGWIAGAVAAVVGFLTALPGQAATAFTSFMNAAIEFLTALPMQMAYWFGFALGTLVKFAVEGVVQIISFGVQVIAAIIEFFSQLPTNIANFLTAAYDFMVAWVTRMINETIRVGSNVLNTIVTFFTQLPGKIASFLTNAFNVTVTWSGNMIEKAKQVGTQVLAAIVTFFSQLPGKVAEFLGNAINNMITFATNAFNEAGRAGREFVRGLSEAIAAAPGVVQKIVNNMISEITGAVTRAYNAVKDLGGEMWRGFKDGMGIKSPSFIEKATTAMVRNVNDEIKTLEAQVGHMQSLGATLPNIAGQMDVNLTGAGVSGGTNDAGLIVNMEFNGVAAADIPEIKSAMTSSEVLTKLTQAAKAGRR